MVLSWFHWFICCFFPPFFFFFFFFEGGFSFSFFSFYFAPHSCVLEGKFVLLYSRSLSTHTMWFQHGKLRPAKMSLLSTESSVWNANYQLALGSNVADAVVSWKYAQCIYLVSRLCVCLYSCTSVFLFICFVHAVYSFALWFAFNCSVHSSACAQLQWKENA